MLRGERDVREPETVQRVCSAFGSERAADDLAYVQSYEYNGVSSVFCLSAQATGRLIQTELEAPLAGGAFLLCGVLMGLVCHDVFRGRPALAKCTTN
jgi:hypothetical protein